MPGSLYRRNGRWTAHLSWQKGGKQHQTKRGGFRTRKEAEVALVDLAAQVQGGRFVPAGRRTFGDYLTGWLDGLAVAGRRETTIASYRRLVKTHISPALGDILLVDLTAVDLDQLYSIMTAAGLKARTVRFAHSVCHKALADAERKGVVPVNVASKASPPKSSACRAPEAGTWTPEQLRTFLDQTAEHHHGALIRLAGMTGLRRGELCGLRWEDVDLDGLRLSVRQTITTVDHRPVLGDVKTGPSRRVVDLDEVTVAVLRRHRTRQREDRMLCGPGWNETGLVFAMPDGRLVEPGHDHTSGRASGGCLWTAANHVARTPTHAHDSPTGGRGRSEARKRPTRSCLGGIHARSVWARHARSPGGRGGGRRCPSGRNGSAVMAAHPIRCGNCLNDVGAEIVSKSPVGTLYLQCPVCQQGSVMLSNGATFPPAPPSFTRETPAI